MTPEQIFSLANTLALIAWIVLAVAPRLRWVPTIIAGLAVPAVFGALYVWIIATHWGSAEGGFSSLPDVARLFSSPWLLLAGWVHYLAFDLLIGSWEVRDAQRRNVPHLLVVPCLALTFMFGPAGWLSYLIIRSIHGRRLVVDN